MKNLYNSSNITNYSKKVIEFSDWDIFQNESDIVRNIIFMYKTKICTQNINCITSDCFNFHSNEDKRRKPYDNAGKLVYYPKMCPELCSCIDLNKASEIPCKYSHNQYEFDYHPYNYKTVQCPYNNLNNSTFNTTNDNHNSNNKNLSQINAINNSSNENLINTNKTYHKLNSNLSNNSDNIYTPDLYKSNSEFFDIDNTSNNAYNLNNEQIYNGRKNSFCDTINTNKNIDNLNLGNNKIVCNKLNKLNSMELNGNINNKHCTYSKYCPFYHNIEEKRKNISTKYLENSTSNISYECTQIPITKITLENLPNFKTIKCEITIKHSEKECYYYHTSKDKRRSLFKVFYYPSICLNSSNDKVCSNEDLCNKSHNQVELFYHPEKFKTKYCSYYNEDKKEELINDECGYGALCSFAHNEKEIRIELIHKLNKDENFFIYFFKTILCPFNNKHDKSTCVYSHNLQDYRRCPNKFVYDKKNCLMWDNKKTVLIYSDGCNKGYQCMFSHGWKELDFHPLNYKTVKCKFFKGICDKGLNCPFYHYNEDKRIINEHIIKEYNIKLNKINNSNKINNNSFNNNPNNFINLNNSYNYINYNMANAGYTNINNCKSQINQLNINNNFNMYKNLIRNSILSNFSNSQYNINNNNSLQRNSKSDLLSKQSINSINVPYQKNFPICNINNRNYNNFIENEKIYPEELKFNNYKLGNKVFNNNISPANKSYTINNNNNNNNNNHINFEDLHKVNYISKSSNSFDGPNSTSNKQYNNIIFNNKALNNSNVLNYIPSFFKSDNSDNESHSIVTKRSISPVSSEINSSFNLKVDIINEEYASNIDYNSNILKEDVCKNINKQNKVIQDLFNQNIDECFSDEDKYNEENLIEYLDENNFTKLKSLIKTKTILIDELCNMPKGQLINYIEDDNLVKLDKLFDYLLKFNYDNYIDNNILDPITRSIIEDEN